MQTDFWARRCAALFVGLFLSVAANATDYVTVLTLQQPSDDDLPVSPFVEQVEFRWSSEVTGGAVSAAALDNFSVRLLQAVDAGDCVIRNGRCTQIYSDNIIEDGVVQPIGGQARNASEVL